MSEQYSHLPPEYGPHPQFPKSVKPGIPKLPLPKAKWQTVKIGDLFKVINDPVKMEDDQQYDLVTVKRARGGVVDRETLYGRDISVKSQFYVHEGNFLISKRQIVHGACGFVPRKLEGAIVSNEYSVLACTDLILPAFLNYLSYTPYFQQTCFHSSIGVHVEKMIFKLDEWFRWKINIPSLPEQQKIADFLSSVDAKLAKLSRKKALLEDYKRGLMQQIFSQKIRFKQDDGSEFPEWEKVLLGNLFTERSEKSDGDNELLSVTMNEGVVKRSDIGQKDSSSEDKSNYKKVYAGDIAYNSMRMWQGASGLSNYDGIVSPAYTVVTPISSVFPMFFAYFFKYQPVINLFRRYSQGLTSDTWNLKFPAFSKIIVFIPESKEEQQKIADFLSSFDQKIDVVAKQIGQLETFKKGLLQKLFV